LVDRFAGLHSLWRFDPILVHDFPLRGFAIVLFGHITLGRTHLDRWSACFRDLYLPTPTLTTDRHPCPRRDRNPARERPQTHVL